MKSESMKPEKTNLIGIGYIEDKNKYFATFQVSDLTKNEIERIIKYIKISGNERGCKHHIKDGEFYIIDFFEAELFESMYKHMIKSARDGVIPERVKPEILDKEVDICLMERDVEFAVRAGADPERYRDLVKGVVED